MYKQKIFQGIMIFYVITICFIAGLTIQKFTYTPTNIASPTVSYDIDVTASTSPQKLTNQFAEWMKLDSESSKSILVNGIPAMRRANNTQGILDLMVEPKNIFDYLIYWTSGIDFKKPLTYLASGLPQMSAISENGSVIAVSGNFPMPTSVIAGNPVEEDTDNTSSPGDSQVIQSGNSKITLNVSPEEMLGASNSAPTEITVNPNSIDGQSTNSNTGTSHTDGSTNSNPTGNSGTTGKTNTGTSNGTNNQNLANSGSAGGSTSTQSPGTPGSQLQHLTNSANPAQTTPAGKTRRPRVLIYHTHTSETYIDDKSPQDNLWHTIGSKLGNVTEAGAAMAKELRNLGVDAYHDLTPYDRPFDSAYENSRKGVRKILNSNKFDIVIDLHRDGSNERDKNNYRAKVDGNFAAQVMLIVTKGRHDITSKKIHPNWQTNYRLCSAFAAELQQDYPGLLKKIDPRENKVFNQDLHPQAILIEVGYQRNTTAEAEYTGKLLARVLAQLLKEQPSFLLD